MQPHRTPDLEQQIAGMVSLAVLLFFVFGGVIAAVLPVSLKSSIDIGASFHLRPR